MGDGNPRSTWSILWARRAAWLIRSQASYTRCRTLNYLILLPLVSEYATLSSYHVLLLTWKQKSICHHASQFNGSNQHDSQEFLTFLLDGLHEDLNRVLSKPTNQVSTPEREAELEKLPQQVASAQEWEQYKKRNDSLIVDYFQGQFRNRMECLTCNHVRRPAHFTVCQQSYHVADFDHLQLIYVPITSDRIREKSIEDFFAILLGRIR